MVTASRTALVPGPQGGSLEVLVTGHGEPSTVFVHGLAGSIATTRPYAGLVEGRRIFMHLAGHGRSTAVAEWTYAALAAQVRAVADHDQVRATAALGISMGAGALCAGMATDPGRFERLMLVLPAVLDHPRDDAAMRSFAGLARLLDLGDVPGVARHLLAEQPEAARSRPDVQAWCRQHAERLMHSAVAHALQTVPHQVPLSDRDLLRQVRASVLVLAQHGDPVHAVSAARELAEVLPAATLEVLPAGGVMWAHRDRVRHLVGEFLSAPPRPRDRVAIRTTRSARGR